MANRQLFTAFASLSILTLSPAAHAFGMFDYRACEWSPGGTNYVSTLNYQGKTSVHRESAEALEQTYSGIQDTTNLAFTTLQAEMAKLIDTEGRKISEYTGSSVTLGSTFDFKMTGRGTYSAVNIALPSISAAINLKKKVLWGLISASCTVSVSIPTPSVTGNLDVASGTLSAVDVHAATSADVKCKDNIPLLGFLVADLLDHFADKALQPTLAKINAPGGYPLKAENFGGLNKLLSSNSLSSGGQNIGASLGASIENFVDHDQVELSIHAIAASGRPAEACLSGKSASTSQTMLSLSIPTRNDSLTIQVEQLYTAVTPGSRRGYAPGSLLGSLGNVGAGSVSRGIAGGIATHLGALPPRPATPVAAAPAHPGATSPATGATLTARIAALQNSMNAKFGFAPSVLELVHESATSEAVVDASDLQDSAIWTGVYLGSQCLREAATTDPTEKAAAAAQISYALGSVERLFDVTGTPGLLARFAFNTQDPVFSKFTTAKNATAGAGWTASTKVPGWLWMPGSSRDQYTGVLFGLGLCNRLTTSTDVRTRTSTRIVTAVNALLKNGWNIPYSSNAADNSTANSILLLSQVTWLKLAAIAGATAADRANWEAQYESRLSYLRTDPISAFKEELDPTFINNYEEYYTWNLGYLRFYPVLMYETNPANLAYFRSLMTTKLWNETYTHGNSMFTYMKVGTMGIQTPSDTIAVSQALISLKQLAARNRRDFAVDNTANPTYGRNNLAKALGQFIQQWGLQSIGFFAEISAQQAGLPIPLADRAPSDYMWQISPFQLTGGGNGTIEAPPVDAIFAYWLGRYHKLLSAQN